MAKNQIDYASLRMSHHASVYGTDYWCFRDQHGRELLARAGDQFRSLWHTVKTAKQNQGVDHGAR